MKEKLKVSGQGGESDRKENISPEARALINERSQIMEQMKMLDSVTNEYASEVVSASNDFDRKLKAIDERLGQLGVRIPGGEESI